MFDIHRIVIRRLILAWMAISLVTACIVYYVESSKIETAIITLANARTQELELNDLLTLPPGKNTQDALQQRADAYLRHHFVLIEIFDRSGKRIAQIANPAYAALHAQLETALEQLPRDLLRHTRQLAHDGNTFVEVTFPVHERPDQPKGHVAAVFMLDPSIKQMLSEGMERSLGIVLLIVLGTTLALYPVIIRLNRSVLRASSQILQGNFETASVLSSAIALRDSETGDHNYRVTLYAMDLAEMIHLDNPAMRGLILGALLHDVGKIGIPDHILHKPDRLTPDELELMHQHVAHGVRIIGNSKWLRKARDVIEYHHEKYDGSGYLKGLRGHEIPEIARIFAIVDVFDALASRRPYKNPMPTPAVTQMLLDGAGTHFDPDFVRMFATIAEARSQIVQAYSSAELIAEVYRRATPYFLALNAPGNRR